MLLPLFPALRAALAVNLASVHVAFRKPRALKSYLSAGVRNYREALGSGLKCESPFGLLEQKGWSSHADRFELPLKLSDDSGTGWDEQMCLGAVTKLLRPKTVFEIGTYNGRTTSIFVLNVDPGSTVITLDLPVDAAAGGENLLESDRELVARRKTGYILKELGLASRYRQILFDSLEFDPTPYAGSVELGFIDGGHSLACVRNDTEKMAVLAGERGLVFWHDYGGLGDFADLTQYLEDLSKVIPIYKVPTTTLAWAAMPDLAKLRR